MKGSHQIRRTPTQGLEVHAFSYAAPDVRSRVEHVFLCGRKARLLEVAVGASPFWVKSGPKSGSSNLLGVVRMPPRRLRRRARRAI